MSCTNLALDRQQIEAVVACEDAQLVLASAGSGKTLSLLAKIEYIHYALNIPPQHILVISFTQKTVQELKERCKIENVEIRTFHSLGNSILRYSQTAELAGQTLISDAELSDFIHRYCKFLIKYDQSFAENLVEFLLFNFPIQDLNNYEKLLKHWLMLRSIDFHIRTKYPYSEISYRPTFTILAPNPIYIDIAIFDRPGHSPLGRKYLREFMWRQKLHRRNHTRYIILPSWR